ncbi:hypothetical protein LCGC14_1729900, partial [marine sediment metagenome]
MADFYVQGDADFVAGRDGTNNGAEVLTGPGGIQIYIRGGGGAAGEFQNGGAVAGDRLLGAASTVALSRLVVINMNATDGSAWEIGDVVRNKTGAGDHWTGKIVQERDNVATGLTTDQHVLVQLDSPADFDDVNDNKADGIENTTKAEDDNTIDDVAAPGIRPDTNSGDGVTGHIEVIGVKADWSEMDQAVAAEVNSTDFQLVLDGGGIATNCLVPNGVALFRLENVTCQNAVGDGLDNAGGMTNWRIRHCAFSSNGGIGFDGLNNTSGLLERCLFSDNGSHGMDRVPAEIHTSEFANNTNDGFNRCNKRVVDSLVYGNGADGISTAAANVHIIRCVLDGNVESGLRFGSAGTHIRYCRITNNRDHGIEMDGAVDDTSSENFNLLHNNSNGDLQNIIGGFNSYGDDANHISDPPEDIYGGGYTKKTILVTVTGGTDLEGISEGTQLDDNVAAPVQWSMIVRNITVASAGNDPNMTITFEADTVKGPGNP